MIKRYVAFLLIIINLITLSGCWNYREIDNLPLVMGCAIDKGENGKKYHLTVEIAKSSGGTKAETVKSQLFETDSDTIFDAIRSSKEMLSKKLFWDTCELIVVSQDIAKEDIAGLLDFFVRDQGVRETVDVAVSQEKTAKEILKNESIGDPIISYELESAMENNVETFGTTYDLQLYEIYNILGSKGKSLVLPAVRTKKNNDVSVSETNGIAIFKENKLIGFLDPEDTRYFLFVINKIKGGILIEDSDAEDKNDISLEISENKSDIKDEYKDGKLSMKVDTNTTVFLGEVETDKDVISKDSREKLISSCEKSLETNISNLIKKVQTVYGVDIFGFGSYLSSHNPKLWEQLSQNWEETFKNLDVDVSSKISIDASGTTSKPTKPGEK